MVFHSSLLICVLVQVLLVSSAVGVTVPGDVAGLAALKASVIPSSVPAWSCMASWNFAVDPCVTPESYFVCGVTCSVDSTGTTHRITGITLDAVGYTGILPVNSLSKLTGLKYLDISDNNFHGPIIASAFSTLSSLRTLVLSSNSFSGDLNSALFAKLKGLETLDLSRNFLTGELPNTLGYLTSLRTLDLSFNRLSGKFPESLPPNIVNIAIRGNRLKGVLSKRTFEPLKNLAVADLAMNNLSGDVEGWLLHLPSLQQLNLSNNSLSRISVDGISARVRSGLVAVDLSFNIIEGSLPETLATRNGFPALVSLSLRHNRLKGEIPTEYRRFRRLFLDGNFLNGKVPKGFFSVSDVAGSFGDNCLDGCPPAVFLCAPEQKPRSVCKEVYGGIKY